MKYLSILILLFIGCGHQSYKHDKPQKKLTDTGRFAKFAYIARENNIPTLVSIIDSSHFFCNGYIGLAGEETEVYDSYQRLLEIAPDTVWVNLSYHKNPITRVFAFEALRARNSPHLPTVKDRLKQDKAAFLYISWDVSLTITVSSFVSDTIPTSMNKHSNERKALLDLNHNKISYDSTILFFNKACEVPG